MFNFHVLYTYSISTARYRIFQFLLYILLERYFQLLNSSFTIPNSRLSVLSSSYYFIIERNPERALRNANDLFILPHRVEFVKRLPLYTFPLAWNSAPGEKLNPRQHLYLCAVWPYILS